LRHTPLSQAATAAGLRVLEIEKINRPEEVAAIAELKPEVIVVVAFGQMIRAQVRELAPLGAFNLHASLLPELRGAAPINWAVIRGYKRTGVTTFSLVDALDAGPMYVQAGMDISVEETVEDLKPFLAALGAKAVCETLDLLAGGGAMPQPQDDSKATLAPILKKTDGMIDWKAPAETIRNLIHGTWPWPAAHTVFQHADAPDKQVQVDIARARVVEGAAVVAQPPSAVSSASVSVSSSLAKQQQENSKTQPGAAVPQETTTAKTQPGTVRADLTVGTGEGTLQITRLQPAGKRVMEWRDFVNGYRVRPGDRFVEKT
jgi:methionyl-tRNA formyltransferase